jgi:hypothetical protein
MQSNCGVAKASASMLCGPADIYLSYWWLLLLPVSFVFSGLVAAMYVRRSAT